MPAYNLSELESALSSLDPLRATVQGCSEESTNHRSRAWGIISDLERIAELESVAIGSVIGRVSGLLGGLSNEVRVTCDSARSAYSQHQSLVGMLEGGYYNAIPDTTSGRLAQLAQQIGSGIEALGEVLAEPENPFAWIQLFSTAIAVFEDGASLIDELKTTLEDFIPAAKRMMQTADQPVVGDVRNIIASAGGLPGVATAITDIPKLDDIINAVSPVPILGTAVDMALQTIANGGSFGDVAKETLATSNPLVGGAFAAAYAAVGGIATVGRLGNMVDSGLADLAGRNTPLGQAYLNIANAWGKLTSDSDTLGTAVDDLARAFVDMHGGTFLLLGVVALGAVTVLSGGTDIPILALAAGVSAEASAGVIPTFMVETAAGSNFSQAPKELGDAWKATSTAVPAMVRDGINILRDQARIQLQQSRNLDTALDVAGNPTFGPMLNVASAYTLGY